MTQAQHSLPLTAIWRLMFWVALVGVVLAGFIATLKSCEDVPLPVLILLALLGVFSYIARQTASAAASTRSAAIWKRPASRVSRCAP
jgi:D-xylose transport system permease protein